MIKDGCSANFEECSKLVKELKIHFQESIRGKKRYQTIKEKKLSKSNKENKKRRLSGTIELPENNINTEVKVFEYLVLTISNKFYSDNRVFLHILRLLMIRIWI